MLDTEDASSGSCERRRKEQGLTLLVSATSGFSCGALQGSYSGVPRLTCISSKRVGGT